MIVNVRNLQTSVLSIGTTDRAPVLCKLSCRVTCQNVSGGSLRLSMSKDTSSHVIERQTFQKYRPMTYLLATAEYVLHACWPEVSFILRTKLISRSEWFLLASPISAALKSCNVHFFRDFVHQIQECVLMRIMIREQLFRFRRSWIPQH